jgi:hypothetical protein
MQVNAVSVPKPKPEFININMSWEEAVFLEKWFLQLARPDSATANVMRAAFLEEMRQWHG